MMEKNPNGLSFNLDQNLDVNLNLEGSMDTKNLLLFYNKKIILSENQNYFLLN